MGIQINTDQVRSYAAQMREASGMLQSESLSVTDEETTLQANQNTKDACQYADETLARLSEILRRDAGHVRASAEAFCRADRKLAKEYEA